MTFYLIGTDHRHSPLNAREAIYRKREEIAAFLESHASKKAALLTTCNRVEVYGISDGIEDYKMRIRLLYERFPGSFNSGYTFYGNGEVFAHVLRLACGLESQIKGEPQILQQMKDWLDKDLLPPSLGSLWLEAVSSAAEIRLHSGLSHVGRTIADLVFGDLLKQIGNKNKPKLVIVGTGKVAELFARGLSRHANIWFIANKNHKRAEELARLAKGNALLFKELPAALSIADALVSATTSPHFVLGEEYLSQAVGKRSKRLYLYDLAMPRDVEPDAGNIEGVSLKNLDDLAALFEKHAFHIKGSLEFAEHMVEEAVKEYQGVEYDKNTETRHAA